MDSVTRETVTAIVVCHGRDLSYFADTLAGVSHQRHQADHIVVAVPTLDPAYVELAKSHLDFEAENVHLVAAMGKNLGQVLSQLDFHGSDWLWILHADSCPYAGTLDILCVPARPPNASASLGLSRSRGTTPRRPSCSRSASGLPGPRAACRDRAGGTRPGSARFPHGRACRGQCGRARAAQCVG